MIDPYSWFTDHEVCDSDSWIKGVSIGPNSEGDFHVGDPNSTCLFNFDTAVSRESFHPNSAGTTGYAELVDQELANTIGHWRMMKIPSAHTAGHTPRPVVWVLGSLSLAILLIGAWVLRALHDGLSPHDSKPHGAETRSAVQAAEQTAHALEQADRDGTLTELEARSAVAGGGVLTRLRLEEDSGRLTVAFPYTAESRSTGATLHRYVCVYFLVLTGHGVDTDYSGGCTAHPQPFTGTATPES